MSATAAVLGRRVLGEEAFGACLVRERSRGDRAGDPLVLLVVTRAAGDGEPRWPDVIAAADAAARRTDVMGWLQQDVVLALVLVGIRAGGAAEPIAARVRRRLDAASPAEPVGVHVHAVPAADPLAPPPPELIARKLRRPGEAGAAGYETMKRAIDLGGSALLLTALSPLFALVAAAVKCSSRGPVLFRQRRVGRMMRPFDMLKFRTMTVGSAPAIHQAFVTAYIEGQALPRQEVGAPFKIVDDPRVTWLGRVLRRTSLDELPQLWNVLRGEMSLVGPRPPIPYEVDRYQAWHCRRILEAKPGITGLWQVSGRSRTTFDEMVRLDLRYARSRSLWTDLKILFATPAAVIGGKGAC